MAPDADQEHAVTQLLPRDRHGIKAHIEVRQDEVCIVVDGVDIHPGQAIDVADMLVKYAGLCKQIEMMRRKKLAFIDLVDQDGA